MRILSVALGIALVLGAAGCSSQNQEQAKEDAKKAGHEIKAEAKELKDGVNAAVKPDSESASDKMAAAGAKAQDAASHAGIKLDHAALLAKVKTKLASEAGLSTLTNIDVTVAGSEVTLSGTVANEDQKKAAEQAASQVDGVTRVHNQLAVQP